MSDKRDTKYGIADLAELGGVSRRTVRYYVQRGLIPAPTGTGRGKHYTSEHLDRLIQVRTWQEEGVALIEIDRRLHHRPPEPLLDAPIAPVGVWRRVTPHRGVELHIHTETRLDEAQIERILATIRHTLRGK